MGNAFEGEDKLIEGGNLSWMRVSFYGYDMRMYRNLLWLKKKNCISYLCPFHS